MDDVLNQRDLKTLIRRYADVLRKQMRIDAIYLFGSYARNKADKFSDIDLLIVSPDFGDNLLENQLKLLRARRGIDYRIEPHPVLSEDLDSSVLFTLASGEMRKIV